MTKEQELMAFLHHHVFAPILNSPKAPSRIKSGVNLTIGRMNRLSAAKMVQYFWSALATDNAIEFSKQLRAENLPCFEDIMERFKDKFNETWLNA